MLLSGNLNPPTMMVPLAGVPPPLVPPQAAATVARAASAANSQRDARVRCINNPPGPGGPPRSNSGRATILPLSDLEGGCASGDGRVQQPDPARDEQLLDSG